MYEIITPNSPYYNSTRLIWNRSIERYPDSIAYCRSYSDVQEAILFARNCKREIRIRSGGHNYEGFCIADQAFIIDISGLNEMHINYSKNTVTVQGGVINAQLYNFLAVRGYPFPGGTCPTVSISGFTLGGGWGYTARYYGLGCDNLLECKMVDYNERLLTANETTNPALFWALRGAGSGNFGVVVEFTFRLPPKVENVTLFEIYYPNQSKEQQIDFLTTWQSFITKATNRINMNGGIYNTAEDGIYSYLRGLFLGTKEDLDNVLTPFSALPDYTLATRYTSFLEAMNQIFSTYPPKEYFKSGGRFVTTNLSKQSIQNLVDILWKERPNGSYLTSINVFGLGGRVKDIPIDETAFYFRYSNYILQTQSVFEDNRYRRENINFVINNYHYIETITSGSYINFPFTPLKDYMLSYYGPHAYRLIYVKHRYDPYNVFHYEQSIPESPYCNPNNFI